MHPMTNLLTTKEAAERLGVTVYTVARYAREGRLTPALRLPGIRGAMFFQPEDIEALESGPGEAA